MPSSSLGLTGFNLAYFTASVSPLSECVIFYHRLGNMFSFSTGISDRCGGRVWSRMRMMKWMRFRRLRRIFVLQPIPIWRSKYCLFALVVFCVHFSFLVKFILSWFRVWYSIRIVLFSTLVFAEGLGAGWR